MILYHLICFKQPVNSVFPSTITTYGWCGPSIHFLYFVHHPIDPNRVAAGLKAAIHNPNVSEGAKEHAADRLHEMGKDLPSGPDQRETRRAGPDMAPAHGTQETSRALGSPFHSFYPKLSFLYHFTGGYKATLSSSSSLSLLASTVLTISDEATSEAAKQHAREVLEAAGYHTETPANSTDEEHRHRIIGGYRAALNSTSWLIFTSTTLTSLPRPEGVRRC
jgi:hypothetical protein